MNKTRHDYGMYGAYLLPIEGFGNEVSVYEGVPSESLSERHCESDPCLFFSFRDTILKGSLTALLIMLAEDVDSEFILCYIDPTGEIKSIDRLKDNSMVAVRSMHAKPLIC